MEDLIGKTCLDRMEIVPIVKTKIGTITIFTGIIIIIVIMTTTTV